MGTEKNEEVCGCGDYHCQVCNPDWLMFASIEAGIANGIEQMKKVDPTLNPMMVKMLAQFAAGKAVDFYMEHEKKGA